MNKILEGMYGLSNGLDSLSLDAQYPSPASLKVPRQAIHTFKYFIHYEVSRICLSLGVSLEDAEIRGIAETFAFDLHEAPSQAIFWDVLTEFGRQISRNVTNNTILDPIPQEVWNALNHIDAKGWPKEIELSGLVSFGKLRNLEFTLNPPRHRPVMNKFAHRFGSDRFLMLRLPLLPFKEEEEGGPRSNIVRWLVDTEISLIGTDHLITGGLCDASIKA